MSVRCPRCPAEAKNLIALAAHVRDTHGARTAPAPAFGAGYEDTGELEACEACGRLERLRPVARSTWSLDPQRRTAMVCAACAGASAEPRA